MYDDELKKSLLPPLYYKCMGLPNSLLVVTIKLCKFLEKIHNLMTSNNFDGLVNGTN